MWPFTPKPVATYEDILAFEEYGSEDFASFCPAQIETFALATHTELDMALTSAIEHGNIPLIAMIGGIASTRQVAIVTGKRKHERPVFGQYGDLIGRAIAASRQQNEQEQ